MSSVDGWLFSERSVVATEGSRNAAELHVGKLWPGEVRVRCVGAQPSALSGRPGPARVALERSAASLSRSYANSARVTRSVGPPGKPCVIARYERKPKSAFRSRTASIQRPKFKNSSIRNYNTPLKPPHDSCARLLCPNIAGRASFHPLLPPTTHHYLIHSSFSLGQPTRPTRPLTC